MRNFNITCLVEARLDHFNVRLTLDERIALVDYLIAQEIDLTFNFDNFVVNGLQVLSKDDYQKVSRGFLIHENGTRFLIENTGV